MTWALALHAATILAFSGHFEKNAYSLTAW